MRVPKHIEKKIYQRVRHAEQFLAIDNEICDWLEGKGFNLGDPYLTDHTRAGAESLCNPWSSAMHLIKYIENYGVVEE